MLLEIHNLEVSYGAIKALHGVSLSIDGGEIVALIGSNGAGKTTLLRTISGLLRRTAGEILWNGGSLTPKVHESAQGNHLRPSSPSPGTPGEGGGEGLLLESREKPSPSPYPSPEVPGEGTGRVGEPTAIARPEVSLHHLHPHEIVRLGISQVPEGRQVFPDLSVRENLLLGGYQRTDRHEIEEGLERGYRLFPILAERRNQRSGTLSGGEQQMLAIARALMVRPTLLLLDEPSLGLAPLIVRKIFEIIRTINTQGTTVFLVEQNAHMALNIANRGYVLETGRVILADKASALLQNDEVKKAYLGG